MIFRRINCKRYVYTMLIGIRHGTPYPYGYPFYIHTSMLINHLCLSPNVILRRNVYICLIGEKNTRASLNTARVFVFIICCEESPAAGTLPEC